MKTTNLLWILCLSLSASLAAVTATMLRVLDENRNLRREIHTARADLDRVGDEVKALEEAKGNLTDELADQRDELDQAENELADAKEINSKTNEVAAPRPAKVRTFSGKQYLGMSWLVPTGVTKDTRSGMITYEPVLFLDDTVKQNLVTYQANVVERDVPPSTTVNYNYPWVYYYPVVLFAGTNKAAHCDSAQMPRPTPTTPSPPRNSTTFSTATVQRQPVQPILRTINPQTPLPGRVVGGGGFPAPTGGLVDPARRSPGTGLATGL